MLRKEFETCPFCEVEITKNWDVEKNGYRITCPNCGKKIMLCDACLHSEDNEGMRCNWSKENGCFRHLKKSKKINYQEKNYYGQKNGRHLRKH